MSRKFSSIVEDLPVFGQDGVVPDDLHLGLIEGSKGDLNGPADVGSFLSE